MSSLSKYQSKRQFSKTPEPVGKSAKDHLGPLSFVVQKHQATQLHYDFRLELNGVLKSWAVPKGPSTNSQDKHLAVLVEDHPLDYKDFEGIIPKGNYGGGSVMVWDTGVYTPVNLDDFDSKDVSRNTAEKILNQQFNNGHMTFVLLGKKLKGEFALIKIKKSDDNAWLLIKKGDEYASTKDILKEDKSATTGRTMTEIAGQAKKKGAIWQGKPKNLDLSDAPIGKQPKTIKPMLAGSVDQPFNKKNWLFELKWDGFRTIAEIQAGKVKLYSRNNQPLNLKFAPVVESLKKFPGNAVLDGEVVVMDSDGHPNFQLIQDYPKSKGELVYCVFDLLFLDGHNLENLPLLERKSILSQILPDLPHLRFSDHVADEGVEFFKQAEKLGLEGMMAKDGNSTYQEGVRSDKWLKVKTHLRTEAVIAGFTKPQGERKHFGALILGIYEASKLKYVGHTGGGFDDKLLESIYQKLKPLETSESPFEITPKTNAPVTWVTPKLICQVKFAAWTSGHQMRQPIFLGLVEEESTFSKDHPDQESEEVVIGKRTLRLTHLSKVFWPKEGITKGDLVNYYKEVSPFILPYLKDRPESLLRYPNGVEGEGFFQKDASNLKMDWVLRARIQTEHKNIEYLLCQDQPSLIYLINLGCIDLNPWNSRVTDQDKPDYLVIDLDPEEVDFKVVVEVAISVHEVLESLGIEGYPKTSGASGIHIYLPMEAKYDYEHVRQFAELLCHQINQKIPSKTSLVRSPKERQGKVYLDYLQNSKGQTLASVYSVRPKPGATVSTPLKWSELTPKLHPSQFDIKNIPERLEKVGDLFKGVLGKGINIEKVLKKLSLTDNIPTKI